MPITTSEQREQHPLARLIPQDCFEYYLDSKISNFELKLMEASSAEELADVLDSKAIYASYNPHELICAAFSPNRSNADISMLASRFIVDEDVGFLQQAILITAALSGRKDLFKTVIDNDEHYYVAFHLAASWSRGRDFKTMIEMLELIAPDKTLEMITARQYKAYTADNLADSAGVTKLLIEKLASIAPDKVKEMVSIDGYKRFIKNIGNIDPIVVARLLRSSEIFDVVVNASYWRDSGHTEEAKEAARSALRTFVSNELISLRARKSALGDSFDVTDPAEIRLYLKIANILIMRNEPASLPDLEFLLDIPAVRARAHFSDIYAINNDEVRIDMPCELIGTAREFGNSAAEALLTQLPEVARAMERQSQLGLQGLAADKESSMAGLDASENAALQEVKAHYQPAIDRETIPEHMQRLRQALISRYERNPAKVMLAEGREQILPVTWKEFTDLNLQGKDLENALLAYYQHVDHTALRYISKPNDWMNERAEYVQVNPNIPTERWADFEGYQEFIVMLWLAAKDDQMPATDGHTLSGRIDNFVQELALIGRAHNCDGYRMLKERPDWKGEPGDPNGEREEQYDDLKGDRPSCYSGQNRRLYQSVIGHPLLTTMLTKEKLDAEVRDFVRDYFKAIITDENKTDITKRWHDHLLDPCKENAVLLKVLDIPAEKKDLFIDSLKTKYGAQFEGSDGFKKYIDDRFILMNNQAHAITFGKEGGLSELLPPLPVGVEQALPVESTAVLCYRRFNQSLMVAEDHLLAVKNKMIEAEEEGGSIGVSVDDKNKVIAHKQTIVDINNTMQQDPELPSAIKTPLAEKVTELKAKIEGDHHFTSHMGLSGIIRDLRDVKKHVATAMAEHRNKK